MIRSYADLFSGCGGFSTGFYDRGLEGRLSADSWQLALGTARLNHPETPTLLADLSEPSIRDLVVKRLEGVDLLLGGPPCQGFSTLGKRRDDDERSTLVDAFAEICVRVRPKVAIVENVKGITTKRHPNGHSYAQVLQRTLEQHGYKCSSSVLTLTSFGAAQTRSRWFFLAVRDGEQKANSFERSFWRNVEAQIQPRAATLWETIGDLPRLAAGEGQDVVTSETGRPIYNHRAMNHSTALVNRIKAVPPGGGLLDVPQDLLTPHLRRLVSGGYGSGGHIKNVYGRLEWDKTCGTILAGMDKITCGRFVHPDDDRLLTPRECARLQGFNDDFIFTGGQVGQYYQIGNAVPPIISRVLASATISAAAESTALAPPREALCA